MTKRQLLAALLLAATLGLHAQEPKKEHGFLGKAFTAAKTFLDDWAADGIDSAYVRLPEKGAVVSVSANFARITAKVNSPLITQNGAANMKLHSQLNGQTSIYLGYRGIGLDYSYDFLNGYSNDFSLSLSDNSFGLTFRRHGTTGMHGRLRSDALDDVYHIKENDTKVKTTMLYGYYLFNGSRFSLSAATDQSSIQVHSAGSPILMALYQYTELENKNPNVAAALHGLNQVQMNQGAVGLGYTYNYALHQGRVLLHAMLVPMLIFHNNNWVTIDYDMAGTTVPVSQKIEPKHRLSFTEWAQVSATWNINKRCYLAAMGTFNHLSHKVKNYNISIAVNDWLVTTQLGYRF